MASVLKTKPMQNTIETFEKYISLIDNGEIDALEAYIKLKAFEKSFAETLKRIEPLAFEVASKWNEKTFTYKGAEIQKKNSAGRYDFSHIPQYIQQKDKLKSVEELAKQALASKKHGVQIIDDNGEVVQPAIYTEGKSIISVRILDVA